MKMHKNKSLMFCWWAYEMVHPLGPVWWLIKRLNVQLAQNQPNYCTPWHLSQRNKDLCSHKNPYMSVYSSFTHNSQNLETTSMSFNGWMVKQAVLQPYIRILFKNKME